MCVCRRVVVRWRRVSRRRPKQCKTGWHTWSVPRPAIEKGVLFMSLTTDSSKLVYSETDLDSTPYISFCLLSLCVCMLLKESELSAAKAALEECHTTHTHELVSTMASRRM